MSKIIILDSIRSMQNVWAIFRNADGAWFNKVIMTWHTPHPPRNDISKTALWAEWFINWEYQKDIFQTVLALKEEDYKIYSVELDERSVDYTELFQEKEEKVALIMWNEINGVNPKLLDLSDKIVIIPMRGKKNL